MFSVGKLSATGWPMVAQTHTYARTLLEHTHKHMQRIGRWIEQARPIAAEVLRSSWYKQTGKGVKESKEIRSLLERYYQALSPRNQYWNIFNNGQHITWTYELKRTIVIWFTCQPTYEPKITNIWPYNMNIRFTRFCHQNPSVQCPCAGDTGFAPGLLRDAQMARSPEPGPEEGPARLGMVHRLAMRIIMCHQKMPNMPT
jgi:hypothetical protein